MPGDRWETCRSFEQLLSKDYTTGKALAHGFGPDACKPDYSYLKGDITQAYTDKVKEAKTLLRLPEPAHCRSARRTYRI